MMRAVTTCQVADLDIWEELAAICDLAAHTELTEDPHVRLVDADFEREVVPRLGDGVLVRNARRDRAQVEAARQDLAERLRGLRHQVRAVLHAAQRHALDDDVVFGVHAWDPENDGASVRGLVGAGLMMPLHDAGAPPFAGRYRLHPDLPPPPPIAYDFSEAVMEETEDLGEPLPGPMSLLHDLASLAAVLHRVEARRTHKGTVSVADVRKIGRALAAPALAQGAALEEDARWGRALRALEALGAIGMDPLKRTLQLDLGLERTLAGEAVQAADRFVHRLLDRDLHVVLPAVRAALSQAGEGAIDEMIFAELLHEQHREIIFPKWVRGGQAVYPVLGEAVRPMDEAGWERIEVPMIDRALSRCVRLGLIRRAPGVFAGTFDGRRWAGAPELPPPPVWISSDLELLVPPDSITPWERWSLEHLGACLQRDTVDRYALTREGLTRWLRGHSVEEALALLERRAPAVPRGVGETLRVWAASSQRIVLTRGVLLPAPEPPACA